MHDELKQGSSSYNGAGKPRSVPGPPTNWEDRMTLGTVLLIILILVLIGAIPTWPYSSGWGYYPAGGIGTILIIVLILLLLGRI